MPDKTYAKFILNNETYLDLTSDTVDSSSLLSGYTAHDRSGAPITGSFDPSVYVLKAGDTMTGPLILSGAPTENLHAATKKYVDDTAANYVTLTTDQNISGTKTFVGQKKILFKQSSTSDKLGFTLYKSDSTEQGYLEYNPSNKVDNAPLFTLGNYASTTSGICQVGFRRYSSVSGASGAYNLLTPLIADAKTPFSLTTTYTNFYLPLGFKINSTTNVLTAKSGLVDLSDQWLPLSGGTLTGALTLSGAPTSNLHAATKKYVDDNVGVVKQENGATDYSDYRVLFSHSDNDNTETNSVYKHPNFTFRPGGNSTLKVSGAGDTSSIGRGTITLGNAIASGSEGNSYGSIRIYGHGTYYYNITGFNNSVSLTANQDFVLPNKSGTIAITDDLNNYVPKSGGTITGGYLIIEDTSLTSGSASADLALGNSTSLSSAGSSFGVLHLYGTGIYKSSVRTTTLTGNRLLYLPDKDGTLAVTDDLDSYVLKSGDSMTGALSFYDGSTLKSKISNTELQVNGHDLLSMTPHFAQMFATAIPANANLNTTTYLKCGQYYCSSTSGFVNSPTSNQFVMEVMATIYNRYDDESGTADAYRIRKITDYVGNQFIQYCSKPTNGSWNYGTWNLIITSGSFPTVSSSGNITTSTTFAYTGKSVTIPSDGYWAVSAYGQYGNSQPQEIGIGMVDGSYVRQYTYASKQTFGSYSSSTLATSYMGYFTANTELRAFARYTRADSNYIAIQAKKLP